MTDIFDRIEGYGLLLSKGQQWHRNRKLLTPAFHFDVLKPYMQVYNEAADTLIVSLAPICHVSCWSSPSSIQCIPCFFIGIYLNFWQAKWMPYATRGESVEIYQPVSLCTLNIIMRCAFSYNADVQGQGWASIIHLPKSIHETKRSLFPVLSACLLYDWSYPPFPVTPIPMPMQWSTWLPWLSRGYCECPMSLEPSMMSICASLLPCFFCSKLYCYLDFIYYMTPDGRQFRDMCKYAHQVAYDLIAKRKKALEENPDERKKRYLDFLDILLLARDESGKGLSELEMRQEVDTFLFEGVYSLNIPRWNYTGLQTEWSFIFPN